MYIAIFTILGLCAGSFVNALVWRVHEQSKSKKPKEDLSISRGRSMCPNCKHTLAWYDLLPVISWVVLRGKCRYCKKPISAQYPLVELLTAILFVWSYLVWQRPWDTAGMLTLGLWLATLVGLVALLIYDLRWMLLPNRILLPLFVPAVLYAAVIIGTSDNLVRATVNTFLAILFLGGLFWVLFQLSGGKWIGGGDVKLGFLLGLLAGTLTQSILLLFLASILGTIVSIPLLISHKAKASTRLAFGPFLITACLVVVLYGAQIVSWYDRVFLLGT